MTAIAKVDPAKLTLRQNAFVFSYVTDAVLEMAAADGHPTSKPSYIREELYEKEISYLESLGKRRQYTPAIYEWMKAARDAFAQSLEHDRGFQRRLRDWPRLSIKEREKFLRDQIEAQFKSFSQRGIEFTTPPITFRNLKPYGKFSFPLTTHGPEDTEIEIDAKLLKWKRPLKPLAVAFHEAIHATTWQLARAVTEGRIGPVHPLYEDALKRKICIHASAAFPGRVARLFLQCPEEDVAYTSQFRFEERLAGQLRAMARPTRRVRTEAAVSAGRARSTHFFFLASCSFFI